MNNIILITLGILIPFIATIIGSSLIFFFKNQTSLKFNSIVNGFSAGIMISASFFGLGIAVGLFDQCHHDIEYLIGIAEDK